MNFELTKSIAKHFALFKNVPFLPSLIDEQLKVFTLFFRPVVFSKMTDLVNGIKQFHNVTTCYHKYGGLEFRVNGKEFCHLHGDGLLDVLLNRATAERLIQNDTCTEHHVNDGTGWISFQIDKSTDVTRLIELSKCAYDIKLRKDFAGSN